MSPPFNAIAELKLPGGEFGGWIMLPKKGYRETVTAGVDANSGDPVRYVRVTDPTLAIGQRVVVLPVADG